MSSTMQLTDLDKKMAFGEAKKASVTPPAKPLFSDKLSPEAIQILRTANAREAQLALAPMLRRMCMEHLSEKNEKKKTALVRNFQGEYINYISEEIKAQSWQQFVKEQGKNGAWVTDIEMAALGDLLGVHICVTAINSKTQKSSVFYLHRCEDDKAPTIHVNNIDNYHWFVDGETIGDGNCGLNSFIQGCQKLEKPFVPEPVKSESVKSEPVKSEVIKPEVIKPKADNTSLAAATQTAPVSNKPNTAKNTNSFFNQENKIQHTHIVKLQEQREKAFHCALKPSQLETQLSAEKIRISHLPEKEQQQIANDYLYAMSLVSKDPEYINNLPFVSDLRKSEAPSDFAESQSSSALAISAG